jgi:WD40 repeat protein
MTHYALIRRERRGASVRPRAFNAAHLKTAASANHDGCVNTARWSADGRVLVTGSDDRTVRGGPVDTNEDCSSPGDVL